MAFDLASDVQAKNRHFENQWLIKSTPRASAREDLRRKSRSADLAVFREACRRKGV
jgi:hypothetical protein